MFDSQKLKNDYAKHIRRLANRKIITQSKIEDIAYISVKIAILLSLSNLKMLLLARETYILAKKNKFFPAIACLRMMFEETAMMGFVLSKCDDTSDRRSLNSFLARITTSRYTHKNPSKISEDKKPFRIGKMMQIAEKYVCRVNKKLSGIFTTTYSFLSDYVHPNGPSRFYFIKWENDWIKFRKPINNENDIGMILNYCCMTLDLYNYFWIRFKKIRIPNLLTRTPRKSYFFTSGVK